MQGERKTNVNGMDIYYTTDTRFNSFCVGAYLLAGSMYENALTNGISHLYEHEIFRNLERMYGGERLYRLMSGNGLRLDGTTYKEFMCFTITGVADALPFAAELISKLFLPLEIEAKEFEHEKSRIYCEMNEDDDKHTLSYLHEKCCWGGAFPAGGIAGRRTNIKRISVKQLDRFRESIVSKGNIFFYVTGNVDAAGEKLIESAAAQIPLSPARCERRNIVPLPEGFRFGSEEIKIMESDWCKAAVSFGIDCRKVPLAVRELIYSILFKEDDCAFNMWLSENDPTAYSFSGTLEQYTNFGRISLSYETTEAMLNKSLCAVVNALTALKRGDFDLALNRRKEEVYYKLLFDDPAELNWDLAYYNHILRDAEADFEKPALGRYETVTAQQIVTAARGIFTRKNLVLTLRGERRRIDKDEIERILSALDAE